MPDDLKPYCSLPLLLMKALYRYTFSGKFLCEEQEEFLISFGMQSTPMPALWRMHLPGSGVLMVLQYSDNFLIASTAATIKNKFKTALSTRFEIEWKPHADWFLQARIRQDANGNISLDQHRYAKSVVGQYLPNASPTPSPTDPRKFASPLPTNMVLAKANSSNTKNDVVDLETEYEFQFIEAVGSLNFLSGTAYEELFAIRKACKHMHLPDRLYFQALLHLLHQLRCYSPQALTYYRNVTKSPLATMLQEAGHAAVDPSFVWFCDSSLGNCDDSRSTSIIEEGMIVAKAREAPTAISLDLSSMAQSKRGFGNPSGVVGKSHICSNADETVPRSATVSFALDSLSDGVSSVQFTPSSTISPQVESCSLG